MPAKDHVLVRMYRIGFGDAFVLQVPTSDGVRTVLIDCGRHFQTPTKTVAGVAPPKAEAAIVQKLVDDLKVGGAKPKIDLVIATHRHQDHVSGFASKLWANVTVGEVWMPWTEDPNDPEATKIRNAQSKLALALQAEVTRSAKARPGLAALVANSLSNAPAMKTLHQGFAGSPRRRFLEGKMQTLAPKVLPGVRVHVLGPARDEDIIRDMDPPAGQSYLRARAGRKRSGERTHDDGPFDARWSLTRAQFAELRAPELVVDGAMRAHLEELAEGDPFVVAAALEKSVNGTSLMLAFEVGKAVLLFPGDAQWGTWKRALASTKARAILERTTFYKVGHHGSHNATPKDFVEQLLGDDFTAMASLWPIAQFPRIPKKELMTALGKKTKRVARADAPPKQFFRHTDEIVEAKVPIG